MKDFFEIVLIGEVAESAVKNLANEMITIIKWNGIKNVLMVNKKQAAMAIEIFLWCYKRTLKKRDKFLFLLWYF